MAAGQRAKSLVERILAFSRGGIGQRVPVHVQSVVEEALQALQAAVAAADPADRIVVFGSFYTVGGVLINGTPRLHAKHLGA